MLVCSDENVLATTIVSADNATRLLFVNTNYHAASTKRECTLILTQFPVGESVSLAWSGAVFLLAWTASGHLAIVDYQTVGWALMNNLVEESEGKEDE
ncbi:hypothetical protein PSACC_00392 [Paramicrosporidium saccamoebae]|uniref:Uncharacterized protein n=1 Tax=Paramicrosporidium saccamoebae TaxID=1246581 RepID=A0A2H9TPS2_9FUNG|nr:hypothetical protein PSACC_00392 [Paramicrosporidium saccamoebae]